jgi:hypothetical protein
VVNEARNEVELKSRFDETTHVFSFMPNRMAKIEGDLRKNFGEIIQDLSQMGVRTAITVIRLTYVLPKAAKPMTEDQAGEILNSVGFKPLIDAVVQGIKWMKFGLDGDADAEAEGAANPTEASGETSA